MVSAAELPPGGEGKIEVKVNTAGRKGPLEKTVDVASNDPVTPHFSLKMKGQVEVLAAFEPFWLSLGRIPLRSSRTETVRVVGRDASKVRLSEITVSDESTIKAEPIAVGDSQGLKVTVEAGSTVGAISGTVTAKTGLQKPATLSLNVRAEASLDIFVEPSRIVFADSGQGSSTARVTLKSLSGRPFKVLRVSSPDNAIEAVTEKGESPSYILKLRHPGKQRGTIVFRTDRKDQPEITVEWTTSDTPALRRFNPDAIRSRVSPMRVKPDLGPPRPK